MASFIVSPASAITTAPGEAAGYFVLADNVPFAYPGVKVWIAKSDGTLARECIVVDTVGTTKLGLRFYDAAGAPRYGHDDLSAYDTGSSIVMDAQLAYAEGGEVERIIAGSGVAVSPPSGTGDVTVRTLDGDLVFSTGITEAAGVVTNDLIAGKAGGQTILGGTAAADALILKATSNAAPNSTTSAVVIQRDSANTNSRPSLLVLRHRTTGVPALGLGGGIEWQTKDSAGNDQSIAKISPYLVTVTDGSEASAILFQVARNGALQSGFISALTLFSTGSTVTGYGTSLNTSADVLTAAYQVDSGTVTAGVGATFKLRAPSDTGTQRTATAMRGVLTTVTNAAETSEFRIGLRIDGSEPAEGSEQFKFSRRGLEVGLGGLSASVVTKTDAYDIADADSTVFADASGGAFTLTLPTAVGRTGRLFLIKRVNSGANAVTIDSDGGTIDGASVVVLSREGEFRIVQSDGTNWHILAGRDSFDQVVVLGAAATSFSFSNLDGENDGEYEMTTYIVGNADNYAHLLVNGGTTNLSYEGILADGSPAGFSLSPRIVNVNDGGQSFSVVRFMAAHGGSRKRFGFSRGANRTGSAWNIYTNMNIFYDDPSTAISSIGLESDSTDGFGIGTISWLTKRARRNS